MGAEGRCDLLYMEGIELHGVRMLHSLMMVVFCLQTGFQSYSLLLRMALLQSWVARMLNHLRHFEGHDKSKLRIAKDVILKITRR